MLSNPCLHPRSFARREGLPTVTAVASEPDIKNRLLADRDAVGKRSIPTDFTNRRIC